MRQLLVLLCLLLLAVGLLSCVDSAPARADGPVAAFFNWRAACVNESAARANLRAAAYGAPMMMASPVATYSSLPMYAPVSYSYAVVPEVTIYSAPVFSGMVAAPSVVMQTVPDVSQGFIPRACTQAGPAPCTPAGPGR